MNKTVGVCACDSGWVATCLGAAFKQNLNDLDDHGQMTAQYMTHSRLWRQLSWWPCSENQQIHCVVERRHMARTGSM